MAKTIDLYVDQGANFVAVFPAVTDDAGVVVDLSNFSAVSQMRRSYFTVNAIELNADITDAANGQITLTLSDEDTSGIFPTRYVYDTMIIDNDTLQRTRVFEGLVTVNPGVSDKPMTVVINPNDNQDWGTLG